MYLLFVTHPNGTVQTVPFVSAFTRALFVIGLACQPVTLRYEDPS
jgi:hypothetical protein